MWKKNLQPDRQQMTIWRIHIACWITEATNTRREYVTPIADPLQQRLHECASMLRFMYFACLAKHNSD